LAPNTIIVDVGAYIGTFTVKAAKKVCTTGLVVAFEPHPDNFKFLLENIKLNQLKNVIPLNAALWSSRGTIRLYLGPHSGTHSAVLFHTDQWIEVPTQTLDNVVRELSLSRVDFIKIDAEGAELEILKGAKETLKTNGLKLSIAVYHTPSEAKDVSEFLKARGFMVVCLDGYVYAYKWR